GAGGSLTSRGAWSLLEGKIALAAPVFIISLERISMLAHAPRASRLAGLALVLFAGPLSAEAAPPLPKLATEVAFKNLAFHRPVAMAYPDDGSHLLFVVEQDCVIWSFPNDKDTSDKQVFLDIRRFPDGTPKV